MKKLRFIPWLLVFAMVLSACVSTTHAAADDQPEIAVTVDGKLVEFPDGKPFVDENSRTLVPARFIGEALGATVTWEGETQTASFHRVWQLPPGQYEAIVSFRVGQTAYTVQVKGPDVDAMETRTMDTQAVVRDGRIYVPARYLAEALSATVGYDGATRTVIIVSEPPEYTVATAIPSTPGLAPAPTPPPVAQPVPPIGVVSSTRQYDMNDPNVRKYPIYATARSPEEFRDAFRDPYTGLTSWQSAAEILAELHRQSEDPVNWIDGISNYEWLMGPAQRWVDRYLAENGLSIQGKTDFEKTAIIRRIIEENRLEELIGLWVPGFRHTNEDCAHRADAVKYLMVAMDFELLDIVSGPVNGIMHAWNAYWDSTVSAMRFLDSQVGFDVWNLYIDELDERKFILD